MATTTATRSTAKAARTGFLTTKKGQDRMIQIVSTVLCLLGLIIILFPLVWMISTSLKTSA